MSTYPRGKNLPALAGLILCLLLGLVFTCIGTGIEPVEREELKAVTIRFARVAMVPGDYDHIRLLDEAGERYELHAANGSETLARALEELPEGAQLELLLHPEDGYVLGIYRDGTPILGWQEAMQEIRDEDRGFFWMGIGLWACGIFFFVDEIFLKKRKNKA